MNIETQLPFFQSQMALPSSAPSGGGNTSPRVPISGQSEYDVIDPNSLPDLSSLDINQMEESSSFIPSIN
jgi:hypothetical protein